MLLALLSDSHDSRSQIRAALEVLQPHQPDVYLHLGDMCSPEMLEMFAGLRFHFVFGNNDYDQAALRTHAMYFNLHCHGEAADLTLAGKRIYATHGDRHMRMHMMIASQEYDYVFHGHTHRAADSYSGKTRVINPGALTRATPHTVALLDLATNTLQTLVLP